MELKLETVSNFGHIDFDSVSICNAVFSGCCIITYIHTAFLPSNQELLIDTLNLLNVTGISQCSG